MLDKAKIFEKVAVKLCYDCNLPGKALILLKNAILDRKIGYTEESTGSDIENENLNPNLIHIALEAVERSLFKSQNEN